MLKLLSRPIIALVLLASYSGFSYSHVQSIRAYNPPVCEKPYLGQPEHYHYLSDEIPLPPNYPVPETVCLYLITVSRQMDCPAGQNIIATSNGASCSTASVEDIALILQQNGSGGFVYQNPDTGHIVVRGDLSITGNDLPRSSTVNHGQSCNNTSHPINIPTGNKYFSVKGFSGVGVNSLDWSLHFNSHQRPQLWSVPYRQKLIITSTVVGAQRSDGKTINFAANSGEFTVPSQRVESLSLNNNIYTLRLSDNTIETYDTSGQLQSIQYPSGITHSLSYSNNNNTITVTRLNESLVLDLVDDNVVTATLPDNSEINYIWDTSGTIDKLTQVTYADNSTRTYLYENDNFPHYVTGIVDENGNRISSVEYDTSGRAISSEVGTPNSGIERTEITYHDDGTRTVTNSLGKQNTYHFTEFNGEYKMTQVEGHASANCAAAKQAYTYDANGFMASKTDWKGNVTTYVHNDRGLETSRTEASGTPEARTVTTEWHPTFNLRTKITEPERETVLSYDDQGRLISQEVMPK